MNKQLERIRLRIMATLCVISLSICVITFVLWPLSYVTGVQLSMRNGVGRRYTLLTTPGQIGFALVQGEPRGLPELNGCARSFRTEPAIARDPLRWFWTRPTNTAGFGESSGQTTIYFESISNNQKVKFEADFVPIWLVSLLAFVGPTGWYMARRRREKRLDNGQCIYCGTDMSASPYRCPACGKEPPW